MIRRAGLILLCALCAGCAGCQSYSERFTFIGPTGLTNHVVNVSYSSCMMWGKAARLTTETQTMEFLRSVNAQDIEVRPDAKTAQAIADGIVAAILRYATHAPLAPTGEMP